MLGSTIGDETYVRTGGGWLLQVLDTSADDGFTQTAPLVFRLNRNIDYLVEETTIAAHSTHPDQFIIFEDQNSEQCVGEPRRGGFCALWA
jgi:hypothetical protein